MSAIQPNEAAETDALTVLKSPSCAASKQIIARDGQDPEIIGFNAGAWFYVYQCPAANLVQLSSMLAMLETMSSCLVVRGALLPTLDGSQAHRRRKENFRTPVQGRRWICIDFDKLPLPPGLHLDVNGVAAVCDYLITLLPEEFHHCSYHWQLSSSAGLLNDGKVSMHIWFCLDRPVPDWDLKYWATAWNQAHSDLVAGKSIIDTLLFNDVQAHYTAAPTFIDMEDPFPVRSGLVRKTVDEVALQLPVRVVQQQLSADAGGSLQRAIGFEAILAQIGDHAGGEGFHNPIIRSAASYISTHGRSDTDVEALYQVIRERVLAADSSKHDGAHVQAMASRAHIMPAIEQALEKYGRASARRKSRRIEGAAPHFTSKPVSATAAGEHLGDVVEAFFRVH